MRLKKQFYRPFGLRARLGLSLAISAIVCVGLFFVMNATYDYLFSNYYESSGLEERSSINQVKSLQEFVDDNKLYSSNLNEIKKWEKKQPILLLELFDNDDCIYSSVYEGSLSNYYSNDIFEHDKKKATINLADKTVTAYMYSDFTYKYSLLGTTLSIIISLIAFILMFLNSTNRIIKYITRLNEEVTILEGGNLEYSVSEEGNDEITELAKSMNRMREALLQQFDTEQELHKANRRLVTEMSHDLRTPLTSIMLYLEILKLKKYDSDEQMQTYIKKIDEKAQHLKLLSDHLFEYSTSDANERRIELKEAEITLGKEISELEEELKMQGFQTEKELDWGNCSIYLNQEFLHRIFENIYSNLIKYADPENVTRFDCYFNENYFCVSVMNSYLEKEIEVESNGIGIESIRNMMTKMNGSCNVEQTDTSFELTLLFLRRV